MVNGWLSCMVLNVIVLIFVGYLIYLFIFLFKREVVYSSVKKAVYTAEILFDGPDCQQKKKEWVISFLTKNFNLTYFPEEQLDCLIEYAVESLNISQEQFSNEKEVKKALYKYLNDHVNELVLKT